MGRMATRRTPSSSSRRPRGLLLADSGALRKKKRAVKMVTSPNRTRTALLRRINPKASRKKPGPCAVDIPSAVAVTTSRLRMSNFRSSLRKKTAPTKTGKNKNKNKNVITCGKLRNKESRTESAIKCDPNPVATAGQKTNKSQAVVTLKSNKERNKQITKKKSGSRAVVTSSQPLRCNPMVSSTTTTTSTVFALISTSTTSSSVDSSSAGSLVGVGGSSSSRQLAIAMYQERQENVDHHHPAIAASGKTNSKTLQKAGQAKMTCDLKHMVESIERVASGQQWIDTLVASDKIRHENNSSSSSSSNSSSDSSSSGSSGDSSDSSNSSSSSESSSEQSSSSSSSRKRNKTKTKSSQSIHLRNRSVKRIKPTAAPAQSPPPSTGSRRRPNQRRRLACLNAMAKVHCLYESEIRQPLTHNRHSTIRTSFSDSDSDNSDDDGNSSSSSDSSDDESQTVDNVVENKNRKTATAKKKSTNINNKKTNQQKINRNKKKTERKRPASKTQPANKKQRQSMEVPVVDLAALVMPKRMASLNATAILAASSQQWPDSPKPRRGKPQPQLLLLSNSEVDSEDETKKRETKVIPSSPTTQNRPTGKSKALPVKSPKKRPALNVKKNISCVESCSTSTAASTSANSQILRLSANIFHQEVDGHQTTTTKSSTHYHQSLSSSSGSENNGSSVTSSSKTYQSQVTTTSSNNDRGPRSPSIDPTQSVLRITPSLQTQQPKQKSPQTDVVGDGYSPLGALYNMRPPNLQQQQQQQERAPSRHHEQQQSQHHHHQAGVTSEVSSSTNLSFPSSGSNISGGHIMTKDRDKGWSSERVAATSLPSAVTFGGVPLVLSNPIQAAESYMTAAARLTPAFSLYRPPVDIPYASFYPPPPPLYSAAHFAAPSYYRGFALLPPPGSGFVPVALADSYSAYALAAPPPLVGPTNADLAHYLHRYQTLGPPPCSPLTRYLPTPSPCGLGPDWRLTRDSSRSVVELSSSSTMHDDRNPLPLAAAEAAASASSGNSSSSSSVAGNNGTTANDNNTCPKVEAGSTASLNHPMLLSSSSARNYCPFPGGPPLASSAATATAYANRCINANCSCTGQSSPSCPKNVLAGPLTGEGKRSGPNSISHSVIPHPSCQVALVQPQMSGGGAGSSSSSPAVPSLLPELLLHATGPLETAADPQPTSTSSKKNGIHHETIREKMEQQNINNNNYNNNNNNNRKRKSLSSVFPPSPVSSRLRSRVNSVNSDGNTGCGLENCSRTCCCHYTMDISSNARHPTTNGRTSPSESLSQTKLESNFIANDFSDELDSTLGSSQRMKKYKMEHDKTSSQKRHKKKMQQHQNGIDLIGKFDDPTLVTTGMRQTTPKNGVEKKFREKPSLPDVVKSRVMDDPHRKFSNPKKPIKSMSKTKYSKIVRSSSPGLRLVADSDTTNTHQPAMKSVSRRGGSKSRSPLIPPVSSSSPVLRWSNGWSWEGNSFQSLVHLRNEDLPVMRKCYPAMRHTQGDIVRMRDCILLKSGPKAKDLPFVAKVSSLWENADDGEMMMSLLWYYRPEHTEGGRQATDLDDEIFASRHRDVCSVACIEDKCYVLTFNEYCRYRKRAKMTEQGLPPPSGDLIPSMSNETSEYPRRLRLPPTCTTTTADRVFLCRRVYDFRQKRILKYSS